MNALKMRAWISITLVAVLLAAATTCALFRRQAAVTAASASSEPQMARGDALTGFRTEREQLRAAQKAQLNEIIYGAGADAESQALARRQLLALMAREASEQDIEGILKARGFEDVLASVGEQSANILVRTQAALARGEIAVILDLVLRQTGLTGGNVKIIPIN